MYKQSSTVAVNSKHLVGVSTYEFFGVFFVPREHQVSRFSGQFRAYVSVSVIVIDAHENHAAHAGVNDMESVAHERARRRF